jgi:diphosphomevalonate decarboxylase
VHLLYPESEAEKVEQFIKSGLEAYCDQGRWIADRVGNGPKKFA